MRISTSRIIPETQGHQMIIQLNSQPIAEFKLGPNPAGLV